MNVRATTCITQSIATASTRMKSKTREIATSVSATRYWLRFEGFLARIDPRSAMIIAVGTMKSAERYIVSAKSLSLVMIVAQ